MNVKNLQALCDMELTPEALADTRRYVAGNLCAFLQKNERVLICYPNDGPASIGGMLGQVIEECDCVPVFWGPDYRWKALLRQAFEEHTLTVLGPPLLVLGLMKMAKATATPLYIRNVLLCGYPYANWLLEGIKKGLDCQIWGCYAIEERPVVVGFTCSQEAGFHVRGDLYEARIMDEKDNVMADAQRGRLELEYKKIPGLVWDPEESAKILHQPCSCGCDDARILEMLYTGKTDLSKIVLEERFLAWTSVLDYRARQTESGLDLELMVFPGATLPQLPNCAKLSVRQWNPETDVPFCMEKLQKLPEKDW